ncbi:MAG: Fur family transcriptional regulator [Deferribacterales bacterium]|jgi:Fe2+ or Zn2+ uptake regulation protein
MYDKILREKELKVTPQRIFILEEIKKMGHASVEDLHEKVKNFYSSVSLATIYKNIHLLVEEDILTEVPIHGRKPVYEINTGDHVHVTCPMCGNVEDLMNVDTKPFMDEAQRQTGRKYERVAVMLQSPCHKCNN